MFCRSLFVLSCGHWVVCSSSIYGFWLPLWYLRYTDSEYPFDIFKLFLHYLWTIKYNIKTVRMTICDHLYFVYLKLSFNRFSRKPSMFGSSLPWVVCGRSHVFYLRYVCLLAHSGVQHILSCVFLRIVNPMLPVFLDCAFLIAPSVFSNVYFKHYDRDLARYFFNLYKLQNEIK
jgi:hypothetical protein